MTLVMIGYVRPVLQIVTITLPIHYCILSTAYAITIYNVKISNKSYRILEIYLYHSNYPIVFVLDVVYNSVSINFIRVVL